MAEYRRQDMPEDMIVRISPGRNTITVQECIANGVVRYREIDPVEFYFALNGSCISNAYQCSGFLPEHCLHISISAEERRYVIWNPELRADVIYRETEYQNFPLPRLVFGLRVIGNGKVADCSMGVVADEIPTEDTPMFFYPFSNVYEDGRVCTGNNVLPCYKKLSALKNFPRYLLGLPDNDDMFVRRHNRKDLEHKELMEHLRTGTLRITIRIFLFRMGTHWATSSSGGKDGRKNDKGSTSGSRKALCAGRSGMAAAKHEQGKNARYGGPLCDQSRHSEPSR